MTIREVPRRFCDRPGCDNQITAKGCESAGLTTEGVRQVVLAGSTIAGGVGGATSTSDITGGTGGGVGGATTSTTSAIAGGVGGGGGATAAAAAATAPDLCRECLESAETWWTSKQRRQRTLEFESS